MSSFTVIFRDHCRLHSRCQTNLAKINLRKIGKYPNALKMADDIVLHVHEGVDLQPTNCVSLLGVDVDRSLSFSNHVSKICKKAGRQLNALSRLANILTVEAKLLLVRSFIVSHFKFCSTVWHFCSISNTRKMEKIQERALRLVFFAIMNPLL